jgi:hypothetical protein
MTLLHTKRSRILAASASLTLAALIFGFTIRQVIRVETIKHVVYAQDARATRHLASDPVPRPNASPVLVELFTSEGCSDCPPADALLARLQHDQPVRTANIIVLEEHVDYWESLGWHDRFSSHAFTDRQSRYVQQLHADDDYTPQMVVDGSDQFVGSDSAHALRSIEQAARTPKASLILTPLSVDGNNVSGAVTVPASPGREAEVYAALVENTASTAVQRGENGGRTLNHVSVVRAMQRIDAPAHIAGAMLKFSFATPKDTTPDNLRVVVFLQQPGQGPILGAAASNHQPATAPGASLASVLPAAR